MAVNVAVTLKTRTVSGYGNDSNRFGDSNLNEIFVWGKKIECDVSRRVPLKMFSVKAEKKKEKERMADIGKVQKRKEERAVGKAQHEEDMVLLARERARAECQDWEKKEEETGLYSPEYIHGEENNKAVDPEEDRAILGREWQRRIREAMLSRPTPLDDKLEMMAAMKDMGEMEEGDAVFGYSDEVNLDSQVSWWHDKYRPRKPRYFNRVHTGYEWNKYNQTHYDHENPPPMTVQRYKFNIFYPDLVDKTEAPFYTTEKDGDTAETCIIHFHAGPPYEDIAFRIVNKEWEYSPKKGYKYTFERGILHVYFNFIRYRYRR